ncbi:norsolorinic acid reductase [Colletotrichum tamarilloi]|uniref:Norsolorinic acid reductase n=1 Tax=Colletotrichum tamarilloi TaxID=1209934 RepID=A0ABQ9RHS2_9PEZI|nr:norsolorinic acid reductase [Colletotrichum tamarilloi]KAK1504085.1 norsolorinic acid reductase [Colletotrichum tamarilloi]
MTADLPEIMRSLNQLFTSGNVLYFNIANTPVWIVVMCNDYARHQDSAYVFHKAPHVSPILGGRKVDHIRIRIEALSLWLVREDLDDIETAYPFDIGFPYNLLSGYDKHPMEKWVDVSDLDGFNLGYVTSPASFRKMS